MNFLFSHRKEYDRSAAERHAVSGATSGHERRRRHAVADERGVEPAAAGV